MINPFKFFEGIPEKRRVFTDFMDALDDYHLGNIQPYHQERPARQVRAFNFNVMYGAFGRIPNYTILFQPNEISLSTVLNGTVDDLLNGRFEIYWCFYELTICSGGERQDTMSYTIITYDNVDEINNRNLIFHPDDRIIIRYKVNQDARF